jgi:hypothetical protein
MESLGEQFDIQKPDFKNAGLEKAIFRHCSPDLGWRVPVLPAQAKCPARKHEELHI